MRLQLSLTFYRIVNNMSDNTSTQNLPRPIKLTTEEVYRMRWLEECGKRLDTSQALLNLERKHVDADINAFYTEMSIKHKVDFRTYRVSNNGVAHPTKSSETPPVTFVPASEE